MTSERVYLDAVLAPSRSLSNVGFLSFIAITFGFILTMSLAFASFGYYPIIAGLFICFIVVLLVFRHNFQTLRQRTFVRVTAERLDVRHIDGKGLETAASLPSAFARVELEKQERAPSVIKLVASGQAYIIGRFLTPDERKDFVDCLQKALSDARSERYAAT